MISISDRTFALDENLVAQGRTAFRAVLGRTDLGFHQLCERSALWESSVKRAEEVLRVSKRLVVLGIGGSSLGGRVIQSALARGSEARLMFFENVDAVEFWRRVEALGDLHDVHWVFISKSGSTLETLSQANLLNEYLLGQKIELHRHATVISELKVNPLTTWARTHQIPILEVPEDVGGRFSVLTPVGMFPAEFLKIPSSGFRQGASWALKQEQLVAEIVAASMASFSREEWITLFWTYTDSLQTLGLWFQQLWAESLAQAKTRTGKIAPRASTPIPLVGANDQHSVLQQVMEGARDKFVWFVRSQTSENWGPKIQNPIFENLSYLKGKGLGEILAAEAKATATALQEAGVHSQTLYLERVDAPTLGALFMLLELVTATAGEILDVNAFGQPGVELGKSLAKKYLSN
jgi:glucose-6-phosphate isomerase